MRGVRECVVCVSGIHDDVSPRHGVQHASRLDGLDARHELHPVQTVLVQVVGRAIRRGDQGDAALPQLVEQPPDDRGRLCIFTLFTHSRLASWSRDRAY